jgi:hypothetical protein
LGSAHTSPATSSKATAVPAAANRCLLRLGGGSIITITIIIIIIIIIILLVY